MFDKNYESRLVLWHEFREYIETSQNPIQDAIEFYRTAPLVSIQTDPYDRSTWPDPWEILRENLYCDFVKLLAICYTLQLTERFNGTECEIHIVRDDANSDTLFLLFIGDICVGYDYDKTVPVSDLPENLYFENSYLMPSLR